MQQQQYYHIADKIWLPILCNANRNPHLHHSKNQNTEVVYTANLYILTSSSRHLFNIYMAKLVIKYQHFVLTEYFHSVFSVFSDVQHLKGKQKSNLVFP